VERCLNIAVAIANLCGPVATHLRTGKSAESPSYEELLSTSHHRAQCGPLYHRLLVFCNASACSKTLSTSLSMYSYITQELT
jgi:hypothetical protein